MFKFWEGGRWNIKCRQRIRSPGFIGGRGSLVRSSWRNWTRSEFPYFSWFRETARERASARAYEHTSVASITIVRRGVKLNN